MQYQDPKATGISQITSEYSGEPSKFGHRMYILVGRRLVARIEGAIGNAQVSSQDLGGRGLRPGAEVEYPGPGP